MIATRFTVVDLDKIAEPWNDDKEVESWFD